MDSGLKRTLAFIGAILLFAYVGTQIVRSMYSPVETQMALTDTVKETVTVTGFAIRDEELITGGADGVVAYTVDDGTRVPRGGTVVNVYASQEDAQVQQQAKRLQQKIDILERVNRLSGDYSSNLDQLNAQIKREYRSMLTEVAGGRTDHLSSDALVLLELICQNRLATQKETSLDDAIADLKAQKAALSMNESSVSSIRTSQAGYFIAKPDGYESAIPFDRVLSVTPEQLDSVSKTDVPSNAVGKIMVDYTWYIACSLDTQTAVGMTVGSRAALQITLSSVVELPVTVAAVNRSENGDRYAVVFRCDQMNQQLAGIRQQQLQIVIKEHSGLRVNTKTVRFLDGKKGVYVLTGGVARFREIVPQYVGDGFMICDPNQGTLKAYDDVIVGGKKIYDKKVMR